MLLVLLVLGAVAVVGVVGDGGDVRRGPQFAAFPFVLTTPQRHRP